MSLNERNWCRVRIDAFRGSKRSGRRRARRRERVVVKHAAIAEGDGDEGDKLVDVGCSAGASRGVGHRGGDGGRKRARKSI